LNSELHAWANTIDTPTVNPSFANASIGDEDRAIRGVPSAVNGIQLVAKNVATLLGDPHFLGCVSLLRLHLDP
jgi:hypothetical protein